MDTLYYRDNLEILRAHVKDGCVDLVTLDPPFNSNASYNVLFRAPEGHGKPRPDGGLRRHLAPECAGRKAFDATMPSRHARSSRPSTKEAYLPCG